MSTYLKMGCVVVLWAALGSKFALASVSDLSCDELLKQEGIRLEDTVAAGCELSAQQISDLMDNPVGELITMPLQFDRVSMIEPVTGRDFTVETTKLIPTFPLQLNRDWSLINRIVIPHINIPIDSDAVTTIGIRPDSGFIDGTVTEDPFSGSTSGLGDLTYVGLVTPRNAPRIHNGKLIWAAGPTVVFPTAEEDILGQGKYQLGPAFAFGYLGERWTVGALAQHWWSVGGQSERSSVNQTNLQYFVYYKLPNQWAIGASPNVSIDWSGSGAPTINAPIGIGINKTLFFGKLPVRIGLEATHYVTHESAIKPDWGARLTITPVVPSAFLSKLGAQ